MQTFLPFADFDMCARVLDRQRLGKQRVEAMQILKSLHAGPGAPWHNHPAVLMWRDHEAALEAYGDAVCREWIRRGYVNNITWGVSDTYELPSWLGDERLHASHRAALLAKKPDWYSTFGWTEMPVIDYYWPVRKG